MSDSMITWTPVATTSFEAGGPAVALAEGRDQGKLTLSLTCSGPILEASSHAAAEVESRVMSALMDRLQRSPEYSRLVEIRPHYRAARQAAADAATAAEKARQMRANLEKMVPAPKDLAARLVAEQAAYEAATASDQARHAELSAIEPVYHRAVAAVEAAIPEMVQQASSATVQEAHRQIAEQVEALVQANVEAITSIYLARRGLSGRHGLRAPDVIRRVIESPDEVVR